jgi:hypothetical protein
MTWINPHNARSANSSIIVIFQFLKHGTNVQYSKITHCNIITINIIHCSAMANVSINVHHGNSNTYQIKVNTVHLI